MKGRGGRGRAWRLTRRAPSGTRKAPPMSGGGGTSGAGGERRLRRGSGAGRTKKAGHVEGAPAGVRRRSDGRHVGTPPPRIRLRPDVPGRTRGEAPADVQAKAGHRRRARRDGSAPGPTRQGRTQGEAPADCPSEPEDGRGRHEDLPRPDPPEERTHGRVREEAPPAPTAGRTPGRAREEPRTRAKPDVTRRDVSGSGTRSVSRSRPADVRWWPPVPSHPSPRGSARRRRRRRRPRRSVPRRGPARRARPGRHG